MLHKIEGLLNRLSKCTTNACVYSRIATFLLLNTFCYCFLLPNDPRHLFAYCSTLVNFTCFTFHFTKCAGYIRVREARDGLWCITYFSGVAIIFVRNIRTPRFERINVEGEKKRIVML